MNWAQRRIAFGVAVSASLLVLVLRMVSEGALAEQARLLPFVLPVIAAAWLGGFWPGVTATACGLTLGIYFIVPPSNSFRLESISDVLNALIYLGVGVTISYLCEEMHRARRRETETQFRTLADSIPQLVWMAKPDGKRFWFNQRWSEYTGAASEELIDDGWQRFHDPDHLPEVLRTWRTAVIRGTPWQSTYPLRDRHGQARWHLARAVPVRNRAGEIVCWFGTTTDIEQRVQIEEALKDADAKKDKFLALLAHELRNPLAPISNALHYWPKVSDDKEEMEHLRILMTRQVRQMTRLIDDLMDVSRITHDKIQLQRSRVDAADVVAQVVEGVRPAVDAYAHDMQVSLPNEPLYVDGDAARLMQVVSNIVNNAVKYTPRGGEIFIGLARFGDQAVLRVRDNGPGIPPDMLQAIFEPFRQVDETIVRARGGLGLGLMLAKELVQLHGGTIEARSEGLGRGSEFIVSLPVMVDVAVRRSAERDLSPNADAAASQGRSILVVDDLLDSAKTLARLLRSLGHDAAAVDGGAAAIEWLHEHHPDVIFLDVAMPELDGYETARRLRARPELDDVVLVALTGYGQPSARRRTFEAGFDFHLTKPVSLPVLEDLLQKLPRRTERAAVPL